MSLLGIWQPVGVVAGSVIAYGTAAKYRCDITLPACSAVGAGEACCSQKSNMGWRYEVLIIGAMTLAVFFARYFVFRFHESPKFLVSKGRYQDAIDVMHKIAKFNGALEPTLTVEEFREIDRAMDIEPIDEANVGNAKSVIMGALRSIGNLRGLFLKKLECFTFVLLALAFMVSSSSQISRRTLTIVGRLLVIQPSWLLPPYRSASKQRVKRRR